MSGYLGVVLQCKAVYLDVKPIGLVPKTQRVIPGGELAALVLEWVCPYPVFLDFLPLVGVHGCYYLFVVRVSLLCVGVFLCVPFHLPELKTSAKPCCFVYSIVCPQPQTYNPNPNPKPNENPNRQRKVKLRQNNLAPRFNRKKSIPKKT